MRSDLSAAFIAELARQGSAPVQYLVFHFAAGDEYVSDRAYEYSSGLFCEALVQSWGNIGDTQDISAAVSGDGLPTRQGSITLINHAPDYFSIKFNNESPENVEVDYYQSFEDISDTLLIDTFLIQDPISYAESDYLLSMDLLSANQYADPHIGTLDPDTNEFFGVFIGKVNGAPLTLFGNNPLAEVSVSALPDAAVVECNRDLASEGFTSSGTAIIGVTEVAYTGLSNNTFTGCTGLTDGAAVGDVVQLKGHDYIFSAGSCPVDSVGDLYINGVVYTGSYSVACVDEILLVTFPDSLPFIDTSTGGAGTHEVTVDLLKDSTKIDYWPAWAKIDTADDSFIDCISKQYELKLFEDMPDDVPFAAATMVSEIITKPISKDIFNPATDTLVAGSTFRIRCATRGFPGNTTAAYSQIHLVPPYPSPNFAGAGRQLTQVFDYTTPIYTGQEVIHGGKIQMQIRKGLNGWDLEPDNGLVADLYCCLALIRYNTTNPLVTTREYYATGITLDINTEVGNCGMNPADAIEWVYGKIGVAASVNAPTFLVAHDWYFNNEYCFNGFIPGATRCRQVIKNMLQQCRSRIINNAGGIQLHVRFPLSDKTSVYTSSEANRRERSISVTRQPVRDIINKIDARYNQVDDDGNFTIVYTAQDYTSQGLYGVYDSVLDFYLIDNYAMAKDVTDFWLPRSAYPSRVITSEQYIDAFPLELGDAITLESSFSGLTSVKGSIVSIDRVSGSLPTNAITVFSVTTIS